MTAKLTQTAKTFRKEASAPQGDGTAPQRGYACRKSARMKRHRNETDKERTKNGKQHFYQGRRAGKGTGHLLGSGVQDDRPVEQGTEGQGLHDRRRPGKQEVLSGENLRGGGGAIGCQPTRTANRAEAEAEAEQAGSHHGGAGKSVSAVLPAAGGMGAGSSHV